MLQPAMLAVLLTATAVHAQSTSGGHMEEGNIGLAFGLTALASGACIIGSMLPFMDVLLSGISKKHDYDFANNKPFLASSISFSAGMMLFLTLSDLFPEAVANWEDSLKTSGGSSQAAGIICVAILCGTLLIIFSLKKFAAYRKHRARAGTTRTESPEMADALAPALAGGRVCVPPSPSMAERPSDLHSITSSHSSHYDQVGDAHTNGDVDLERGEADTPSMKDQDEAEERPVAIDRSVFRRVGLQISFALLIHNFPEGLATFATAMVSARTGTVFGVALALHKIPEGVMISLPIFVATGSRWKGFLTSAIIGTFSQFFGAIIGLILYRTYWNSAVSGTLFALVTGILLYTILGNMLPLARSYDPADRYVTAWTLTGVVFFSFVHSLFAFT